MDPNIQWEQGDEQVTATFRMTCMKDGSVKLESGQFSDTYASEEDALRGLSEITHQGLAAIQ